MIIERDIKTENLWNWVNYRIDGNSYFASAQSTGNLHRAPSSYSSSDSEESSDSQTRPFKRFLGFETKIDSKRERVTPAMLQIHYRRLRLEALTSMEPLWHSPPSLSESSGKS